MSYFTDNNYECRVADNWVPARYLGSRVTKLDSEMFLVNRLDEEWVVYHCPNSYFVREIPTLFDVEESDLRTMLISTICSVRAMGMLGIDELVPIKCNSSELKKLGTFDLKNLFDKVKGYAQ